MTSLNQLIHFIFILIAVVYFPAIVFSGYTVEYLPGFPGKLPFNLQTGYIEVGDVEMFYYFIESQGNPKRDPLLLYLTGGPGCSSWNSLVYEIGPLEFDLDTYLEGGFPQLRSFEHSWTKSASIIFLDAPAGTGFSYSTTQEGWPSSDTKTANESYQFLMKWVAENPQYLEVPFFVGGDGYSGKIVPLITQLVMEGIEAGVQPKLNLKGYLVGSPNTDDFIDANSKVEFAHRMALISDNTFENAKKFCKKNYIDVDQDNTQCVLALDDYERCVRGIWPNHILEPKCTLGRPQDDRWTRRSLHEDPNEFILSVPLTSNILCRELNYTLSDIWANDQAVQDALHVRKGTVNEWSRCNQSISYTIDQPSVVQVHQNLINYNLRLLVYSGDRDMVVPFVGVVQWIKSIKNSVNLKLSDKWRPWFVDGQVGGYTRKYEKNSYYLTYATVKGGGHTAAEYYRRECFEMFDRWVSHNPL